MTCKDLRWYRATRLTSLVALLALGLGCSAPGKASDGRVIATDEPRSSGGASAWFGGGAPGTNLSLSEQGTSGGSGAATPTAAGCIPEPFPKDYACQGQPGPWAEALQKTLWFFNAQRSGPGVRCTDVQWRGDAHVADGSIKLDPDAANGVNLPRDFIEQHRAVLDPDGNGSVDLAGGYHDAGDYIKFTLTTTYAISMIAWSLHEYPEAYRKTGLAGEALEQIRWAATT